MCIRDRFWGADADKELDFRPHDDPMAVVTLVQAHQAHIKDNLQEQEQIRPEEIPQDLMTEIKESGQVAVTLKDVRQSIGKDRAQWKLALENELESLRGIKKRRRNRSIRKKFHQRRRRLNRYC